MKASGWIDQARAVRQWGTDYKAAKELGIHRNTVYGYRDDPHATLADAVAVKVALAIGIAPAVVLLDQLAERAKDDQVRAVFLQLLEHATQCDRPAPHLRRAA